MHSVVIALVFAALITFSLSDNDIPQALVIPASEYFEGNDGPWSTFNIRVGTPEQDVRVLVSTASPESMVVLSDYGCSTSVFSAVPSNCAVSRGNLFDQKASSSWHDVGTYGINQNGVGLEANLGYSQRGDFGLEHLGIGLTGPSLENQTVAGIASPEPFYLGIFGLNNQPVNFSTLGNYSSPSFLTILKDQNKIPSLSWSYTAGAKYRLKQVYGQLIFSGYDTSRFTENSVSFTMADDITRDLVVAVQSISYSGTTSSILLSNPINIFIDSTDPNLWLPSDTCDAFERAFGLTLDSITGLYLINDTHHNTLLDSDAQVSFRLSDDTSGGDTVTIVLPYKAFDLTAEYPLVDNTSHYFPLKRANSSTQYTLGRTFLQEAYLSADYERKVFNVSACVWNAGTQQNIVTITSKDSNPATSGGGSSSSETARIGSGAIAGIVVACVVVGILLAAALSVVILRKRRKWMKAGFAVAAAEPEPDESILRGPVFNSEPWSTEGNSTPPMSAVDISAPRSTAEYSRSALAESSARPSIIGENIAGTSTPELDGRDTQIRPSLELDGKELHKAKPDIESIHPVARNPGVYELPGNEVSRRMRPSSLTVVPLREAPERRTDSTLVSRLDSVWQDEGLDAHTVSPATPTRHDAHQSGSQA